MNRHLSFHGRVKRFDHNLSYRNFLSTEIGEMRPVWLEDSVPGDTIQYKPEVRFYFAPLIFPVLSSIKARVDVFFVPNRLAWDSWESFITGGPDANENPAYPSIRNIYGALTGTQQTAVGAFLESKIKTTQSILNDLGHPTMSGYTAATDCANDPYDLIPLYDFQLIWDEYYRDEEKETSVTGYGGVRHDVMDIFFTPSLFTLFQANQRLGAYHPSIAWAKDYFTTASLEQQRGGDVPLLSGSMFSFADGSSLPSAGLNVALAGTSSPAGLDPGTLYVNPSGGTATQLQSVLTINGLRELEAAAAWLNNNVVGGTRYREQLRSRYHVVYSDARLQVPEFVGSIDVPVTIDTVTQTSSTVTDAGDVFALGDRAGKASLIGSGKMLTYSCEEFGYFMAILHIAPKAAYFQGIRRNLQREDRFDFWSPEFEKLPQRPIFNNEIYCDASTMSPETGGTFGYSGMYNEYRHHNDEVHGDFQDTLLAWTFARKFSSLPSVSSSDFLRVDHSMTGNNRVFAASDVEYGHVYGVVNNIVLAKRLISNVEPHF